MEGLGSRGRSLSSSSLSDRRKSSETASFDAGRKTPIPRPLTVGGERTVKRLRLSKALTMPENSSVLEVCRRMAARRVDAALLIESNALLCGILTDKRLCKKMLQGKFRHLPVVENGEVIALLDIAKCLYDAIARMERIAEKGKAIAAAVEGVEKQWGTSIPSPNTFLESLRERMFRPCLSTILPGCTKVVMVLRSDSVLTATKKMLALETSSAVVTVENKPKGILTSFDILMRLIANNLPPDSTSVEKVMTVNPECGTIDTPIIDALHIMHNGKFLHLPVVDKDGNIVWLLM
ncbi:hypothetical protein HPP92_021195 [Vanilla planifolia]|uniref:CBS domain-containing protein n=1 Tax=Vanilla planifolia TaxID=51239 RepID=A0A835Q454_VANPL|nr:hypothetical protein HPP92_021565 [Vanilla planifolia]KAG0462719.1 hypothetical protein HPP92_021195 [Vanilla planifolia]